MLISNNKIQLEDAELYIGMLYEDVESILSTRSYTKLSPNEEGRGNIILKNIDFYELKGSCTLYFRNFRLKKLGFQPMWDMYDFTDKNGNRLTIDLAVERVTSISENGLKKAFGEPDKQSDHGNLFFYEGELTIITSRARSGDQYSIIVRG